MKNGVQFQISYIFVINELELLSAKFHSTGWEYFSFLRPNFSGIRRLIGTCFNVGCVLLHVYYDLAKNLISLVLNAGYCLLPGGYWWLLLVTGGYCSFPLLLQQYERTNTDQYSLKCLVIAAQCLEHLSCLVATLLLLASDQLVEFDN